VVQRFDSFFYFSPPVRPEFLVSPVSSPVMPVTHVAVRDARSRYRSPRRFRRAVLLCALVGITTWAGLATAGLAQAANGSEPGNLILTPASGASTSRPTWSTTDGCPAGHQGSAEVSEFDSNGTLASRISIVVNGGLTAAFRGTFDGNIGALLRVTDIKKGGAVKFAVGCYSLEGGTGSVMFVQSTMVTLSSAGTSYTTSSSGTSGTGTQVDAALIAGACGLAVAVAGIAWYRRRSLTQNQRELAGSR
jgi:hypothetical protein